MKPSIEMKRGWQVLDRLTQAVRAVSRLVWPCACAACGGLAGEAELCQVCAELISAEAAGTRCLRCGATLGPYSAPRAGCDACRGHALRVARVVAVGPHEGALRSAVRRLKFGRRAWAARPLGRLLAERAERERVAADVVVAVPSGAARARRRGFNPAEVVAAAAARSLGLPLLTGILRRVGREGTQTGLGILDRAAAVAGAFEMTSRAPERLAGRRVLLVDDVLTTGATLSECADQCRRAGARSVTGACVTRRLSRARFAVRAAAPTDDRPRAA